MAGKKTDLIQGTLDLLILKTVAPEAVHGYGIAQRILVTSKEILQVQQGSLYPALHRLIKRDWVSFGEGTSDNNRRANYYRLTAKGRKQLEIETGKWDRLARAIAQILRPSEG